MSFLPLQIISLGLITLNIASSGFVSINTESEINSDENRFLSTVAADDFATFSEAENIEFLGKNSKHEYWRFSKNNEICITQYEGEEFGGYSATSCEKTDIAESLGIGVTTASFNGENITIEDAWFPVDESSNPKTDSEIKVKEIELPKERQPTDNTIIKAIDTAEKVYESVEVSPTNTITVELIKGIEDPLQG